MAYTAAKSAKDPGATLRSDVSSAVCANTLLKNRLNRDPTPDEELADMRTRLAQLIDRIDSGYYQPKEDKK